MRAGRGQPCVEELGTALWMPVLGCTAEPPPLEQQPLLRALLRGEPNKNSDFPPFPLPSVQTACLDVRFPPAYEPATAFLPRVKLPRQRFPLPSSLRGSRLHLEEADGAADPLRAFGRSAGVRVGLGAGFGAAASRGAGTTPRRRSRGRARARAQGWQCPSRAAAPAALTRLSPGALQSVP